MVSKALEWTRERLAEHKALAERYKVMLHEKEEQQKPETQDEDMDMGESQLLGKTQGESESSYLVLEP